MYNFVYNLYIFIFGNCNNLDGWRLVLSSRVALNHLYFDKCYFSHFIKSFVRSHFYYQSIIKGDKGEGTSGVKEDCGFLTLARQLLGC